VSGREIPTAVALANELRRVAQAGSGRRVAWPRRGEIIAGEAGYDNVAVPYMLRRRCDDPIAWYFCATCQVRLANVGQIELHVDGPAEVEHRIVVSCEAHGYEESPALTLQADLIGA
jgi:hypothetical protein